MKDMGTIGPAGDFMKDLVKGNFDKAAKDLKQLQESSSLGKMSEAEKKALKEQINQVAKQLKEAANLDQRKQQLEKAKQSGGIPEEQFKKEMAKLNEQAKSLESLQKLAEQLAKAGEQMNKGRPQEGGRTAWNERKADGRDGQADAGTPVARLRPGRVAGCEGRHGQGREQPVRRGHGPVRHEQEEPERHGWTGTRRGGSSRGAGRHAFYGTKAKGVLQKGKAVFEGTAPPQAQLKGNSTITIKGEAETAEGNAADALTNQKVPKTAEKHVRGYFDLLNKDR